jgi:hypothetical protein
MRKPTRKGAGSLEVGVLLPSSHPRRLFSKQINYF